MIPVLMVLSWFLLKARYRLVHFIAVVVCLLGVGAMVGADILSGRDQGSSKDTIILYYIILVLVDLLSNYISLMYLCVFWSDSVNG